MENLETAVASVPYTDSFSEWTDQNSQKKPIIYRCKGSLTVFR